MIAERYRETQVLTASPVSLVVQLYEAAIRHCRTAAGIDGDEGAGERGAAISKALDIVGELQHSLDHERGVEVARNLEALYLFVRERLVEALVSRRPEGLNEAEAVLRELHGAWAAIARGEVPLEPTGPER